MYGMKNLFNCSNATNMSSLLCGIETPPKMSLLSLLFFLVLQSSAMSVQIKCPPHERNYLLRFKDALVDNSSNLQSWQGFNCCEWKGVGCSNHSGGHVILLNLTDYKLGGQIHSSLFKLEYLQHLDLSHNSFSGIPIPSELGKLKRLSFLSLFSSGFQGRIPTNLANLWNLRHLELSSTDNVGKLQSPSLSVWLEIMKKLEHLTLHRVEISEWEKVVTSLSNLRYLRLSDCGLKGALPSSIKNLFNLVHLDLSSNSFTWEIPSFLSQLPALAYLDLSSNHFNGTIPSTISRLVNLKSLLLSSNSLTGSTSLSFLENMTILEQLVLSHNHLTVSVPSNWIPKFRKLSGLGLASCGLAKFPTFLLRQYHMFELDLSGNSFAENIPTWIWEFPELFRLNISSSQLTGRLPLNLAAKKLGFLDLHNNSLEGALPLPPTSILYLDMSTNKFTGSIPGDIRRYLQSAEVFSILRNQIDGRIPDSICTPTMRVLDLADNKLSGTIPLNFTAKCSDLRVLSLGQNSLVGNMPEVGNLTKLQTLNLNGNHLQGHIESSAANCISLQVLKLGNNDFDGSIPQWIGNLSKLQILMLNSNRFQGAIPPNIFALKQLQILDLSHNNLSGSIPTSLTGLQAMVNASQFSPVQLGYQISKDILCKNEVTLSTKDQFLEYRIIFTIFKFMDLSSNNLSGKIPPEIGSLHGLKGLNLSRNHLIDKIPETFGGMDQLESLDLSLNSLSGNIPLELQSLSYLQVFNVSYNRLEGKVPHGGQLLTFDKTSFLGNAHLCDIPFTNSTCNISFSNGDGEETSEEDIQEDSDVQMEYFLLGVGLSYVLGFSIFIGILTLNIKVRKTIFHIYDGIIVGMLQLA